MACLKLLFATTNKGKYSTASRILRSSSIPIEQYAIELAEIQADTVEAIAINKVEEVYSLVNQPVVCMDAGFYINSLSGFPGPYVKYVLQTIGIHGLMEMMEDKDRSCYFEEVTAYFDGKNKNSFSGICKGNLSEHIASSTPDYGWSELFRIFIPDNRRQTLAEMSESDYHQWQDDMSKNDSMQKFANWFKHQHNLT